MLMSPAMAPTCTNCLITKSMDGLTHSPQNAASWIMSTRLYWKIVERYGGKYYREKLPIPTKVIVIQRQLKYGYLPVFLEKKLA